MDIAEALTGTNFDHCANPEGSSHDESPSVYMLQSIRNRVDRAKEGCHDKAASSTWDWIY